MCVKVFIKDLCALRLFIQTREKVSHLIKTTRAKTQQERTSMREHYSSDQAQLKERFCSLLSYPVNQSRAGSGGYF